MICFIFQVHKFVLDVLLLDPIDLQTKHQKKAPIDLHNLLLFEYASSKALKGDFANHIYIELIGIAASSVYFGGVKTQRHLWRITMKPSFKTI